MRMTFWDIKVLLSYLNKFLDNFPFRSEEHKKIRNGISSKDFRNTTTLLLAPPKINFRFTLDKSSQLCHVWQLHSTCLKAILSLYYWLNFWFLSAKKKKSLTQVWAIFTEFRRVFNPSRSNPGRREKLT